MLQIARMGEPILRLCAQTVSDPCSAEVKKIIDDMKEVIVASKSTGVAAPQVFVCLQITVFRLRPHGSPQELPLDSYPWTVLINPEITAHSEGVSEKLESCLSLPDLVGRVPRYDRVTCVYTDEAGARQSLEASGYLARVIQHECDHLQGVLYPQRMRDMESFGFRDEVFSHEPSQHTKN